MLLRVQIENFLSFYKGANFDMFPNPKRSTFPHHVYADQEIPILKQAVVYGANGSGKSNLLNTIDFLKAFVLKKDFVDKELIQENKFQLIEGDNDPCIRLEIEFKGDMHYYIYTVHLNVEMVEEKLVVSGLGKTDDQLIYSRINHKVKTGKKQSEEVAQAIVELLKKNPYSSLLSLNKDFPILIDNRVKDVFAWFDKKLNVLSLNRVFPALISEMSKNTELLNFANLVFRNIGLGVESLEIESDSIRELIENSADDHSKFKDLLNEQLESNRGIARMKNDRVLMAIVREKEEQLIKRFVFNQLGQNRFLGKMDIERQSDGTVKLLNLIPALFDAIHNGYVICIDEIENSIHPALISALVAFFSKSKSNGQLIFTTHETELLNQKKLMRPDEVWFAEKHEGDTKLYSLNDFKEHNTINIRNGYLDGRYGGIPFIGKLEE